MGTAFDEEDGVQPKTGKQFARAVHRAIEAVERLGEENPLLDGGLATQLDEANDGLFDEGLNDALMGVAIEMQADVDDGPSTQDICHIMTHGLRRMKDVFCELSEAEQGIYLEPLCTWLEAIEEAISGYCGGFA